MIKTSRQDVYIRHVENAEANRDGEESDSESDAESTGSSSDDHFFKYQYELFSFGAVLGFLRGEKVGKDANYSQDIRRVKDIAENNKHRQTIDFVTSLVQVHRDDDEDDAWEEVLRFADAGVEIIDEETDEDLDFVRFIEDASTIKWQERLKETIGTPGDVGSL
jgi:hypothetical protein